MNWCKKNAQIWLSFHTYSCWLLIIFNFFKRSTCEQQKPRCSDFSPKYRSLSTNTASFCPCNSTLWDPSCLVNVIVFQTPCPQCSPALLKEILAQITLMTSSGLCWVIRSERQRNLKCVFVRANETWLTRHGSSLTINCLTSLKKLVLFIWIGNICSYLCFFSHLDKRFKIQHGSFNSQYLKKKTRPDFRFLGGFFGWTKHLDSNISGEDKDGGRSWCDQRLMKTLLICNLRYHRTVNKVTACVVTCGAVTYKGYIHTHAISM